MRNYAQELKKRVRFIKNCLQSANAEGIVFGNSGGKDCALVGILCKRACENTVGIIMPCTSRRNYGEDKADGLILAGEFGIETREIDLTAVKETLLAAMPPAAGGWNNAALSNLAPRLRMTALYAVAANENRLVAGTGNRSEIHMGYFTKWGDGGYDFNPIADLTVTEVYEFLRFLNAPEILITKAPSAGLFDGQTDEQEMGITYESLDTYLLTGAVNERDKKIIDGYHARSAHKRKLPLRYKGRKK